MGINHEECHLSLELIILGFGGHARSVAEVALSAGYEALVFIDENAAFGETFLDFPVLSTTTPTKTGSYFPAAGDNYRREQQIAEVRRMQWPLVTLVSPHSTQGRGLQQGQACLFGHHSHVGSMVNMGTACIINTGAIVEHQSKLGDFCHVSINATLAGQVVIGSRVFIGAGATIKQGICIADDVIIGAGATVVNDIREPGVYVGVPARRLVKKEGDLNIDQKDSFSVEVS